MSAANVSGAFDELVRIAQIAATAAEGVTSTAKPVNVYRLSVPATNWPAIWHEMGGEQKTERVDTLKDEDTLVVDVVYADDSRGDYAQAAIDTLAVLDVLRDTYSREIVESAVLGTTRAQRIGFDVQLRQFGGAQGPSHYVALVRLQIPRWSAVHAG